MPDGTGRRERLQTCFVFLGFGLSGAAALIYEVVWTRCLSTVMGSSTYAVSTMLAAFMAGLSAGAALGAALSPRIRRLAAAFAWCELGIGATALLTVPAILAATPLYIRSFYAFHLSFRAFSLVQFLILFAIMAVPTTLMGLTFPLVVKLFSERGGDVGTQAGRLYSINTLGAIAGSTAAGFLLIPTVGLKGSAIAAASINIAVALAILLLSRDARQSVAAAVLVLVLAPLGVSAEGRAFPFFSYYNAFRFGSYELARTAFERLSGDGSKNVVYYHEGVDGNVSLIRYGIHGPDDAGEVLVNDGKREAGDDVGFALLAYLPYLLHGGAPRTALSIGLGSGRTLTHLARLPLASLDSVELNEGILDVNRRLLSPWLFSDPRIRHTQADGRNFLLVSDRRFDLIVASPSWAVEQASAALLTDEFFSLARNRLNDDGVFALWVDFFLMSEEDLNVVTRTFARSFEHAVGWYLEGDHVILIGSRAPFPRTREEVMQAVDRWNPPSRGTYGLALDEELIRSIPPGPLNTDDRPVIEFSNARNLITWRAGT